MPIPTKKIDVGSLSQVQNPDGNQIYRADAQDWVWRDGKWHVVRDISNATDLSKVKPTKYADGTEQPTIFVKDGEEYNSSGTQNNIKTQKSVSNPIIMPTKTKPDELTDIDKANLGSLENPVKAFQIWLKAKYPNADLGKYGVNKDGIDGKMGDLTKKAWEKYAGEFKKDVAQNITPINSAGAQKMTVPPVVANLLQNNNKDIKNKALTTAKDDLFAKLSAENAANRMGKDFADAEMLKNRGITDLIAPAGRGIYGLSQLIKGNKASKNLKPPKRVEPMLPNQQLSSLLAQVGVNANMADPKIRENALRDITTNREMANEVARVASSGDVNSFAQNAQNNYMRSNDAVRKLASDETDDVYKNRALYQSLINTKMQEDRLNHNELVSNFNNIDLPEFKAQREANALRTNQGMNNIFGIKYTQLQTVPLLGWIQ